MQISIDTHTHTIASGHSYSTLLENIQFAKKQGLYGVVTTDHGPAMPGAFIDYTFTKLADIPQFIDGVRAYRGVETNIVDFDGSVDLNPVMWELFDFSLAALHDVTCELGTPEEHTNAMIRALDIPYIDTIAHPGNPYFPLNYEELTLAAKNRDKLLEINGSSLRSRSGSLHNCCEIVRLCRKYEVRVSLGSDAHFCMEVGDLEAAIRILESEGFPEELVVNSTPERFEAYLEERRRRIENSSGR
jgi:putative hydrolase